MGRTMRMAGVADWVIETDRRLIVLCAFGRDAFVSAANLAQRTGRSVQNISIALKELEKRGLIESVDKKKRSWKKYRLSEMGMEVLAEVERQSGVRVVTPLLREMEMRYVRDAYKLVVRNPCLVRAGAKLIEAISRNLDDPKTRTVYVVDEENHLMGMLSLQQFLKRVECHVSESSNMSELVIGYEQDFETPVEKFMKKTVAVTPDERLLTALNRMMKHGLEDLPVVDKEGRLIGELNGFEVLTFARNVYTVIHR